MHFPGLVGASGQRKRRSNAPAECLRTAAPAPDPAIGQRLFLDGIVRDVFTSDYGQYVIDPDGEPAYGVWILTDDDLADAPVIVVR